MKVKQELEKLLGKEIAQSSNEEVYYALLNLTKQLADDRRMEETKKKIYYVSAEFLIGKLLSNNMINLGIYEDVKKVLAESGKTLAEIEELCVELKKDYTIIMVTHNMQQATRIADYTAFFLVGEVVEYAPTTDLFSHPREKKTEDYITGRFG